MVLITAVWVLMPALTASPQLPPDVPAGHWAAQSVSHVVAHKVMKPLPDGNFHGEKPVTRYEMAVAIDRFTRYIQDSRAPLTAGGKTQSRLPEPKRNMPGASKPVTAQELAHALANATAALVK